MIPKIAESLYLSGMIDKPLEIDFDCVIAKYRAQPFEIANACSLLSGGIWKAFPHGVFGLCGRKNGWLLPNMSVEKLNGIMKSREDALEITGKRVGYSNGSAARAILNWALTPVYPSANAKNLMPDGQINYHDCKATKHPDCQLYDISSCYFQLMNRLPTLRMSMNDKGEIVKHPLSREENARLKAAYSVVSKNKILRNSIWGVSLGQLNKQPYWVAGERKTGAIVAGPFQTAAFLVARLGWELTRAASEDSGSVYSNIDCVVVPRGAKPVTWNTFGIDYRLQYEGDADIRFRFNYQIGKFETPGFRKNDRLRDSKALLEAPTRLYTHEWL